MGQTEKRITRGVCLGSSAANAPASPLLFRWEGKGDWCSPTWAVLNYAAEITNNKLQLNQEWRMRYDFIAIHAVHAR